MIITTGTRDHPPVHELAAAITGHAAIVAAIAQHAEEADAERQAARDQADAARMDRGMLADSPGWH